MKRNSLISIITIVLFTVMCGTLVSCENSPKYTPKKLFSYNDVVDEVTEEVYTDIFTDAYQFAEKLAKGVDRYTVEGQMSDYYYQVYGDIRGYQYVYAGEDDNTSIMVRMGADESDLNEDIKIINISYSDTDKTTSGDFTLSYTGYFKRDPASMKVEGKFTLGESKKSIVLSSVVFDNVEYDPDNFNKELKDMLKKAP